LDDDSDEDEDEDDDVGLDYLEKSGLEVCKIEFSFGIKLENSK